MLKSIEFLRGKSRGKVGGGTKFTPPAPVILGLVPRILWKQGTNLINKFALLLHKCWFTQDSWDKPKNDWCQGHMLGVFCMFFKYPSPDTNVLPSLSRGEGSRLLRCARNDAVTNGEGWHRPWCHKILGTDCASRPSMTGGRGAGFVRLLRRCTPRNDVVNDTPHSALKRHSIPQGAREYGRSMIEMLGVLAIIGVLSVGGIAGYSKAMEKWKADRLVSEYSNLILGLLANVGEFQNMSKTADYDTQIGLAQYVQAASLVPQTWKYIRDSRMYDSEGNPILMFSRRNRLVIDIYIGTELNGSNSISGKSKGFSVTLCREIMQNLTKPLSGSLQFSRFYQWSKMEDSSVYWGNAGCSDGRKCLRDLTVSEINDICKSCDKDSEACGINLEF